jgi:exodeoxyribonuclease X
MLQFPIVIYTKMNLLFLDTETTGISLLEDFLFQVCFSQGGLTQSEYFLPKIPISIKAQSITHVTNEKVDGLPSFGDSQMKNDLNELLKTNVLVAHNAAFDICMLTKEGVEVPRFICTLKVARYVDEDCEIPEYNLQYLRYYFGLNIEADAHDAKSDVAVLEGVFNILFEKLLEKLHDPELVIEKMIDVSSKPFLLKQFSFGKYKGRRIEEIILLDRRYMEWMLKDKLENNNHDEDWIFTLKHHLGDS